MADQDTMYWHLEATKFVYRVAALEAALSEIRVVANNADSLADLRRDVKHIAIEALLDGKAQEKIPHFSCRAMTIGELKKAFEHLAQQDEEMQELRKRLRELEAQKDSCRSVDSVLAPALRRIGEDE